MNEKYLWLIITKSRPLPDCEIDMDGCEFYFVDAFVPLDISNRQTPGQAAFLYSSIQITNIAALFRKNIGKIRRDV